MFEDFESLDMYGFLDYLEENSVDIDREELDKVIALEEAYGIYENQYGELCIENEVLEAVMESEDLTEDEAFIAIMEAYEEELLISERGRSTYRARQNNEKMKDAHSRNDIRKIEEYNTTHGTPSYKKQHENNNRQGASGEVSRVTGKKDKATSAIAGISREISDTNKAEKKEREREDRAIGNIGSSISKRNQETDLYNKHMNDVEKDYQNRAKIASQMSSEKQKRNKVLGGAGGAVVGAGVVGAGLLAHKAYKAHKAKKARKRGLMGKIRRLREDEDFNFISEAVEYLMENCGISEAEALQVIITEEEMLSEARPRMSKRQAAEKQREENKPIKEVIADRKEKAEEKNRAERLANYNYSYSSYSKEQPNGNRKAYESEIERQTGKLGRASNVMASKKKELGTAKQNLDVARKSADDNEELYRQAEAARKANREKKEKQLATVRSHYETQAAKDAEGHRSAEKRATRVGLAGGAAVGAVGAAGVYMAHKAYKKHKEEKRKNRGLRGKIRRGIKRLREDYGIYEENGQLFIENEVLDYVMDEFNLYEEDALAIIMEAYEEEFFDWEE